MIVLPPSSYSHFGVYPRFLKNCSLFLQEIYADVLGITLTVTKLKCFFHVPPLLRAIWGRYSGFILGMFHVLRRSQYFWWYFVQNLYLILLWSLSKRLWWGIFLLGIFLVNLRAYSWNIVKPSNSSIWIFVHYLYFLKSWAKVLVLTEVGHVAMSMLLWYKDLIFFWFMHKKLTIHWYAIVCHLFKSVKNCHT